ncbi:MAG: antibiotic biosynthesis monooxygenase [Oscillospiraceae bacterium]|jgi:hypothetical protein|nr:antibiotic biosynthesis monooxygenase [Oscillospiraceae bacterium]
MATFAELKLFQVKPDRVAEFEALAAEMIPAQRERPGCEGLQCLKRFYTIDGVEMGQPPRPLTKVVKCVKYYAWWAFNSKEDYAAANQWFFAEYAKPVAKLLIMPFEINLGDCL